MWVFHISGFVSSCPYLSFLTFCWTSSCPISKFKRNPAATFRRLLPPSPGSLIDRPKTSNKIGKPSASRTNFLPLSENMQCSNKLSWYSNAKHTKMYKCQVLRSTYYLSTILALNASININKLLSKNMINKFTELHKYTFYYMIWLVTCTVIQIAPADLPHF